MPPLYSVEDHPLLSKAAQKMQGAYPAELRAHAEVAEAVLGLLGTEYEDEPEEDGKKFATAASNFVARQVNLQISVGVPDLKSQTTGARSWTYLDVPIDALARAGCAALAEEAAVVPLPEVLPVPRESFNADAIFRFG